MARLTGFRKNKVIKGLSKLLSKGSKISSKDREYFTSNLAYMLKAGVTPSQSLDSLRSTSKSKPLNKAIEQVLRDIDEGSPIWKAFERAKIVPKETLMLVRIGEQSGKLAENLRLAARQEEKQRIFRSKVTSALLYPAFVIGVTFIVAIGVAWFLLPRLAVTFDQLGYKLPLISRIIIGFGLFLQHYGLIFITTLILALVILAYSVSSMPKIHRAAQKMLLRLPGVSKLVKEIEIARFGYMLGSLLQANIAVTESLKLLHGATSAPAYKDLYTYLSHSFENGYNFQSAFAKYKQTPKLIPPPVQQMVIAGERSGALAESLMDVGQVYEEKADATTRNLETVLEPILLILVWAGVLVVAIAVILPIYSLVGKLRG
ncbi:MAG TPA: type II secretion system F family protein [Candidatus Saccharimonadales bacterium]|nr:type II secretion system F family protein [Candidatus Saccharimonadales bacterium]